MAKEYFIGDILKRIKRPIDLQDAREYKLVTIKMNHKGVVLREKKRGGLIKSKMYQVKEGDFILSGIDARNGAFGIVPKALDGAIVTNDFWYFEIDENVISKRLFLELTATSWFDDICKKGSDGTTQRIRLKKDKFFNQEILLPERYKQEDLLNYILKFKENRSNLIYELQEQKSLVDALKVSILHDCLNGNLSEGWRKTNIAAHSIPDVLNRISGDKEHLLSSRRLRPNSKKPLEKILKLRYQIPKTWQWFLLSDVCFYQEGPGIRKHQYRDSGIKILNVQNITQDKIKLDLTDRHITEEEYLDKYEHFTIESDDILFASSGGSWGKTCWFEDPGYKVIMNTSTIRFRSFSEKALNNQYLYLFLKSNFFKQQMIPQLMGMQPNFGSTHLNSVSIPLPPISEQEIIVKKADLMMQSCTDLQLKIIKNLRYAQILMQTVLKEAFEGKMEKIKQKEEMV